MKCYNCKAEVLDDVLFCSNCGSPQKFTDLVRRALDNDQMATTKLYEMTYNNVYQTICTVAKLDDDTVFDLIQNTYIKAFKNLSQLNEPEAFRGWIKTISRNLTIDYLRKKKVVVFSQMVSVDSDEMIEFEDDRVENLPEVVIDQKETKRLLAEILSDLSEEQRIAIHMHYFEELSVKEIAQTLGVSEGTVKSRLNYGRKKVEASVKELEKKGTKLYSLAPIPFLLLLFRSQEAYAAEMPNAEILQNVQNELSVGASSSVQIGNTMKSAGKETAKVVAATTGKGVVTKIIAGVMTVAVVGAGAVGISSMNKNDDSSTPTHTESLLNEDGLQAGGLQADGLQADGLQAGAIEMYEEILSEYVDACENGFDENKHMSVSDEALYLVDTYGQNIYYNYRDIDENGVEELLIGVGSGDYVQLGAVYTFSGEAIVMPVDNFNERSKVQLMNDGSILETGGVTGADGYARLSTIADNGFDPELIFSYTYYYSEDGVAYFDSYGNEISESDYNAQIAGKTEVTDLDWQMLVESNSQEVAMENTANIENLAGLYVHSQAELGIDTVIDVSVKDSNTLILEFDYSGRTAEQIYEAVKEGDVWKVYIEIPSGTAIMTITQNGSELIIEGNDIYIEHAYPRLDDTYVKLEQNSSASNSESNSFVGAYTTDNYCFELTYTNGVFFITSGELPYGGMFNYNYDECQIDGNTLTAKHSDGTDTYVMNSDGTVTVTFSGFLSSRSATYKTHEGSVF